jgi:hypothetical protein
VCDIIAAAAPAAPAAVAVSAAASAASSALVVCLPQHLRLSNDGLKLTWKSVGANEVVPDGSGTDRGSPSARGLLRSASFSKSTSITLSDVSHIIYGPYTDTFAKKTFHDRVDQRWACFSLVLRESRTVDFAAEDETVLVPWLLGLQQLIVYFSPNLSAPNERWTLPKLHLQKLRLKVSGESDRTGQGPYDVVLNAVLEVADEVQVGSEKATVLQAAWRRRNTQGKFQTAVQEMMEINGLIEEIEAKEQVLLEQQAATSIKIEQAMKEQEKAEPPPNMPSARDMKDPQKMQEYMLSMGEYSARQQLKLQNLGPEVAANQAVTAEVNKLQEEKRKLQNFSDKLQFSISAAQLATLSPEEAQKVMDIQKQLGVTPRGSINTQGVRSVKLYKELQSTRLGIIFHQNTPEELNDISADMTPRGAGTQPVVIPVIKVLDKSGIAGGLADLHEGDQVLSVNGQAALSNIQAVQMLREAVGEVVLAVRDTPLTRTPRGTPINPNLSSGLRPINVN